MKAGQLRHRIAVYQQVLVDDGCAGQTETFSLKGSCFAKIESNEAQNEETYGDRKILTVSDHKIKTRHNIGFEFTTKDIVRFDSRTFRVQGVDNAFEHDFKYSLKCIEIESDTVTIV